MGGKRSQGQGGGRDDSTSNGGMGCRGGDVFPGRVRCRIASGPLVRAPSPFDPRYGEADGSISRERGPGYAIGRERIGRGIRQPEDGPDVSGRGPEALTRDFDHSGYAVGGSRVGDRHERSSTSHRGWWTALEECGQSGVDSRVAKAGQLYAPPIPGRQPHW